MNDCEPVVFACTCCRTGDGGGIHLSSNAEFRDPPQARNLGRWHFTDFPQQPYSEGSDQPWLSWRGGLSACDVCFFWSICRNSGFPLQLCFEVMMSPHSSFPGQPVVNWNPFTLWKQFLCSSCIMSEAGQACSIHSLHPIGLVIVFPARRPSPDPVGQPFSPRRGLPVTQMWICFLKPCWWWSCGQA